MKVHSLVLAILVSQLLISSSHAKIGFAFSGGGSRVAQEAALVEALLTGMGPTGLKVRPDVISGASAGSIVAVALNAILATMDGKNKTSPGFDLNAFKGYLFNLTDDGVFDTSLSALARIFTHNIPSGFILDNSPLRKTLGKQLASMGMMTMKDMYIPTCISAVDANTGLTARVCSDDPASANVPIVDAVIASASLPVAFPMATIQNFKPNFPNASGLYIDGGSGPDMIPVISMIQRWNVTDAFLITRQDEIGALSVLPSWIKAVPILANTIAMAETFFQNLFVGAIEAAEQARVPCYQYTPLLPVIYSTLDFGQSRIMYNQTLEWATKNLPVLLNPHVARKPEGARAKYINQFSPAPKWRKHKEEL